MHSRPFAVAIALAVAAFALCVPDRAAAQRPKSEFDHLTTGFELVGKHRDLPCESCHVNAIFKGTPKDCASCHGVGTEIRATAMPSNHILSSNRCGACHTPVAFAPAVNFDHTETRGSCSTCHNGVQAQGMSPTHIQTDLECDVCHTTMGWRGAVFNHVGITSKCASCHNNVSAKGMPSAHVPTAAVPCESCHSPTNYVTFAGALMNHSAVTAESCASCHEAAMTWVGVTIVTRPPVPHPTTGDCAQCHSNTTSFSTGTAMPANHIPTTATCTLCHSNPADFSIFAMNHQGIGSNCAECHAPGSSFASMAPPALKVPPSDHIPFGSATCESCHSASDFTTFQVANAVPPMSHAAVSGIACSTCHGEGKSFVGAPSTVVLPANHIPVGSAKCESCHTPGNFTSFMFANASGGAPPAMVHSVVSSTACSTCHEKGKSFVGAPPVVTRPALTASGAQHPASGECSSCHTSTTTFKGATVYPPDHIPLPNGASSTCTTCHANSADFGVYKMDHSVVTKTCSTCHGAGKSFANMAPPALVVPPANHVPFGTATCQSCHAPSNFTSFMFANASGGAPPAMVHSVVSSTACSTCHEKGKSFVGAPPVVTRPALTASGAQHPASGECSSCHTSTTTFKGATVYPPDHIPLPNGASSTCTTCHANSADFGVYKMDHSVVTKTCSTCHGAGKSFANMAPPALVVPPANHVPFGTATCQSCHAPSNFTSFMFANASGGAPPAMVHSVVSSTACSTCHEKGKSFVGAPPVVTRPALTASGAQHPASGECSSCHTSTTTFKGATVYPPDHIPLPNGASSTCTTCHANSADFGVYKMDHSVVTKTCSTCHGAGKSFANMAPPALVVPPANHVPFGTATCQSCHAPSNFTSFMFANASGGAPPAMVHSVVSSTACSTCHEKGKSFVGAPPVVTRPALTASGAQHPASGECSSCHTSTTTFKGATVYPPDHIPLPNGASSTCTTCHANSADFGVYKMDHSVVTKTCSTCHGAGKSFANMAPPALVVPPANHVPFGTATCQSCHAPSNFTSFMFANASGGAPPAMVHSVVSSTACSTCHEKGKSFVGAPPVVTRPALTASGAQHPASGECSSCHTSTTTFKGATVYPPDHIPLPNGASSTCTTCHANSADFGVYKMDHSVVTKTCSTCHGAGKSFANMAPPALVVPPANHVPFGTATCQSCHAPSNFTTFSSRTRAAGRRPRWCTVW